MNKGIIQTLVALSAMEGMMSPTKRSVRNKPDPSTRKRKEICPNCEEEHENNKHLYCDKECAKEAGVI